jgi:hypothetical protein
MMKRLFIVSLLVTLFGGCVVAPADYRDRSGYYRGHDAYRSYDYRRGYSDGYYPHGN